MLLLHSQFYINNKFTRGTVLKKKKNHAILKKQITKVTVAMSFF